MNIGIIGLGLIGGSIGRAFIKKTNHRVFGLDCDEKTMMKARLVEAFHEELTDENIKDLDLLIVALYPRAIVDCIKEYAPKLKDGAIVMDCGGNKRNVCEAMIEEQKTFPNLYYVGAHPMAGKEFSGFNHSTPTLFDNATLIVVPVHTPIEILCEIKELAIQIGFEGIVVSNAQEHDEMISYTSQLAHIVSSSYIKNPLSTTHYGFSAGSFRDMTRVARLNPVMWSENMLDNRDYLSEQLNILINNLNEYKKALDNNDKIKLEHLLDEGRIIKEQVESMKAAKLAQRIE